MVPAIFFYSGQEDYHTYEQDPAGSLRITIIFTRILYYLRSGDVISVYELGILSYILYITIGPMIAYI